MSNTARKENQPNREKDGQFKSNKSQQANPKANQQQDRKEAPAKDKR